MSSVFGILASLSFLFSCSALGLAEIVPGTDKSDAVCTKQKMAEQPEYGMCPHRAYLLESTGRRNICSLGFLASLTPFPLRMSQWESAVDQDRALVKSYL